MLLLLFACRAPSTGNSEPPKPADSGSVDTGAPDTSADADTDTDADTDADTDTAVDTGPPPDPDGPHAWTGTFFTAPDLRIAPCGTKIDGALVLAPGPDLDGDGLPELAVGAPGYDGDVLDQGAVYLLRGADLASGAASLFSPWGWAAGPAGVRDEGFGERVTWVGDRDGDGVDDLLVGADEDGTSNDVAWVVSGAALLVGGEATVTATEFDEPHAVVARWDDIDGDGDDDWIMGWPARGMGGGPGDRGTLAAVADPDFATSGVPPVIREVYGEDSHAAAGQVLAVLDGDYDGDGIREVATSLGDDVVVVDSGALLDWATYVDELVQWRFTGMGSAAYGTLVALGDVDGGGRDDLLFLSPGDELCVGAGEDADETGGATTCFDRSDFDPPLGVSLGDDLDGDGVAELWGRTRDALVAWSVPDLLAGSLVEVARIGVPDAFSEDLGVAVADGSLWTSTLLDTWNAADAGWRIPEEDGLTEADATAVVTGGGWGGAPYAPAWADLTGDGIEDLAFLDENLTVFDGTQLLAGGELTMCDAAYVEDWSDEADVDWLDDVDGDGAADGLVLEDTGDYRVVSGRVAVGLAAGADIATFTDARTLTPLGCDVDGDGRGDLSDERSYVRYIYSGALAATGDLDASLLGSLSLGQVSVLACVPDLDGDGGDELLAQSSHGRQIFLSSQLDPASALESADAHALLASSDAYAWSLPVLVGDRDGDGVADLAWMLQGDAFQLCFVDPAPLLAGGAVEPEAASPACVDQRFEDIDGVRLEHAVGDDTADVVLVAADADWTRAFWVSDGDTLGAPTELARMFVWPDYDDYPGWEASFGPDVLGTGASSVWLLAADFDVGWRYFEGIYAREP